MRTYCAVGITSLLLLGLPLLGVVLSGRSLTPYLDFPPLTRYVVPAPFSWYAFSFWLLCIAGAIMPCGRRVLRARTSLRAWAPPHCFPWWGWGGLGIGLVTWILAWSRFSWFAPWQAYTFTPLWLSYVLVINALTYRRTGHCGLVDRPRLVLLLFPVSALFWWYFEYLNRFVQNWVYVGLEAFGPWQYVIYATLPFSTVLPAVLGTYEFLHSFPRLYAGLEQYIPVCVKHPRLLSGSILLIGGVGLMGLSLWPDYCFSLLWVAPLLILTACQTLLQLPTIFAPLCQGDWRQIWLWALAALVCGGFWEMWNFYSLTKWVYAVPFVDRFHVFEMPLLGYGGYLSFGLECAALVHLVARHPGLAPE
jgi:hypothetical protein